MRKQVKKLLDEAAEICRSEHKNRLDALRFLSEYAKVSYLAAEDYYNNHMEDANEEI